MAMDEDEGNDKGENLENHLLPTFERLRNLTPEERDDLRDRTSDWIGADVERFRDQIEELR